MLGRGGVQWRRCYICSAVRLWRWCRRHVSLLCSSSLHRSSHIHRQSSLATAEERNKVSSRWCMCSAKAYTGTHTVHKLAASYLYCVLPGGWSRTRWDCYILVTIKALTKRCLGRFQHESVPLVSCCQTLTMLPYACGG